MSNSKSIIPEIFGGKPSKEYIILWKLHNKEFCEWSDFTGYIKESTLSGYLNRLKQQGIIKKSRHNEYHITPKGEERYSELTIYGEKGRKKLSYPPDAIKRERKYDHMILWMLYNNEFCRWSDFKDDPLSINQSSLSKNINKLIIQDFIVNENKKYRITPEGRAEYFSMLKLYDLDRQSILDEESKRIDELTENIIDFFSKYGIEDDSLKFQFLNKVIKLDYAKVENMLKEEEDFYKIVLFLTINHPDQYPDYVSPKEFSESFDIDIHKLNYFLLEIIDNQLFQIKFFKLDDLQGRMYYFQQGETIEKILNAFVEKYITKFTYLNKIHNNEVNGIPVLRIGRVVDEIIQEICNNLFDERLKIALRKFLPEYFNYLAYKIEVEKELTTPADKIRFVTFQNVFDWTRNFSSSGIYGIEGEDTAHYNLDPRVLDTLDIFSVVKLDFLNRKAFKSEFFSPNNHIIIEKVQKLLIQGKYYKARSYLANNKKSLKGFEFLILEDIIFTALKDFNESLKLTNQIIEKIPNAYIGYLFQSITYLEMNEYDIALEVVNKGMNIGTKLELEIQKAQILIKKYEPEKSFQIVEKAILENPTDFLLLRLKLIIFLTHTECVCSIPEEPLNFVNQLLKVHPNNPELSIFKALILCTMKRFREGKKVLYNIEINPLRKNLRIDMAYYLTLIFSYIARGKFEKALNYSNQVLLHYSDHPISYLTKALVFGYSIIYKIEAEKSEELDTPVGSNLDRFLGMIDHAISLDKNKSNQSSYNQFKSFVIQELGNYEDTLKIINKAIELDPYKVGLYYIKTLNLVLMDRSDEALAVSDYVIEKFPQFKNKFIKHKSYICYLSQKFFKALETIEVLYATMPDDTEVLNNRAVILACVALELKEKGEIKEFNEKREEALKTTKKMLELAPSIGNYHDSYGEILMMFNNCNQAIIEFEKALKLEPHGFFAYQTFLKMGDCYKELGDLEKALENYKKGKTFTDRMLPMERDLYIHKANEKLSELKKLQAN